MECRICGNKTIKEMMDLGKHLYTFNLVDKEDQKSCIIETKLSYCFTCGFVFISTPGEAESFYTSYRWPSSYFPPPHVEWVVNDIVGKYLGNTNNFILDIGSNDGYFLKACKRAGFTKVVGIEPSQNCSKKALQEGIETINSYFNTNVAKDVLKKGQPKVVTCFQVLEHVWDLNAFFMGINVLMSEDTTLVLEVPSFETIAQKGDYTSIWEQHVNYFTKTSLKTMLNKFNIDVFEEYSVPFSGGAIILVARKNKQLIKSQDEIEGQFDLIKTFIKKTNENIQIINDLLEELKRQDKRIALFGVGAKSGSLVNFSGIIEYIDYYLDDNIHKQGLFFPGAGKKILSSEALLKENIDVCIISPFNIKEKELEVIHKNQKFVETGGKFIRIFPDNYTDSKFLEGFE